MSGWIDRAELIDQGWTLVAYPSEHSLLDLATELGDVLPGPRNSGQVQRLVIRDRAGGEDNSLTAKHGVGGFPYHTDMAHLRRPPRFVLLRCVTTSQQVRATLLVDFHTLTLSSSAHRRLRRHVWFVNGGRGRFYTQLVVECCLSGRSMVRFDRACMRPAQPGFALSAHDLEDAIEKTEPRRLEWRVNTAAVLDNWRVLHARDGNRMQSDSTRILERVFVDSEGT